MMQGLSHCCAAGGDENREFMQRSYRMLHASGWGMAGSRAEVSGSGIYLPEPGTSHQRGLHVRVTSQSTVTPFHWGYPKMRIFRIPTRTKPLARRRKGRPSVVRRHVSNHSHRQATPSGDHDRMARFRHLRRLAFIDAQVTAAPAASRLPPAALSGQTAGSLQVGATLPTPGLLRINITELAGDFDVPVAEHRTRAGRVGVRDRGRVY